MTATAVPSVFSPYDAGLDAELHLLEQLKQLSARLQRATGGGEPVDLTEVADLRAQVMDSLVALEQDLKPLRLALFAQRAAIEETPAFQSVLARHGRAAALVADILALDRDSLQALNELNLARRVAADALERGETTLAAYRRVLAPPVANASLVNRRG
ncbi:MAG: hypothetical protein AB7G23_04720 [Vicinamibacterales bacterium]